MPIGNVGFTHIQEHEKRLIRWSLIDVLIKPTQLLQQAPGVASKPEVFKPLAELGTGLRGWVEPIHCPRADGGVTQTTKTLHDVGSGELKAITVTAAESGVGHPEQFAELGVQPGFGAFSDPRREPDPEGCMTPVGEMTGSLGAMQRTDPREGRQGVAAVKRQGTVVTAGIQRNEQHRRRIHHRVAATMGP